MNYTNGTTFSAGDFTADKIYAAMQEAEREMDEFRQQQKVLPQARCGECGMEAKVIGKGLGDTLIVCDHMMEAIRERYGSSRRSCPLDQLYGMKIITLDEWAEADNGWQEVSKDLMPLSDPTTRWFVKSAGIEILETKGEK